MDPENDDEDDDIEIPEDTEDVEDADENPDTDWFRPAKAFQTDLSALLAADNSTISTDQSFQLICELMIDESESEPTFKTSISESLTESSTQPEVLSIRTDISESLAEAKRSSE